MRVEICNHITQHEKPIVSTTYVKLTSWSSLCLLKIHMEYVGRVRERDREREKRTVVCREEKMAYDLTGRKRAAFVFCFFKLSF